MEETQTHLDAFEKYLQLKLSGKNTEDSFKLLMSDIGVTRQSLYRWKKEFHWDEKEAVRSSEIHKEVEKQTNSTIIDNKVWYLSIYHTLLSHPDVKGMKPNNVTDVDRAIKGSLLVQGESTERTEQSGKVEHEVSIHDRIKERAEYYQSIKPGTDGND
jgi:hypothetical protein